MDAEMAAQGMAETESEPGKRSPECRSPRQRWSHLRISSARAMEPTLRSSLRLTRALSLSAAEVSYGREVTDEDVAHFVKEGFLIKKNFYSLEEIELIHKVKVSARQRSDLQQMLSLSVGHAADCR